VNLFNRLYVNRLYVNFERIKFNCIITSINVNLSSACSLFFYSNWKLFTQLNFLKCSYNFALVISSINFFDLSSILIIVVSNFVIRRTYQLNFATFNTFNFYILWLVFLVLLRMLRLLFSHKCRKLKYTINKFYIMFLLIICLQNFSYKTVLDKFSCLDYDPKYNSTNISLTVRNQSIILDHFLHMWLINIVKVNLLLFEISNTKIQLKLIIAQCNFRSI